MHAETLWLIADTAQAAQTHTYTCDRDTLQSQRLAPKMMRRLHRIILLSCAHTHNYRTTLDSIRTPQKIFNYGQPRT